MSEVKLIADSGGGSVSLKGPATTTGNAALSYILPDVTTGATIQTSNTAGAIVAVKGAVKTDQFTTSVIDTWTDIGLSITHALSNSSNILPIFSIHSFFFLALIHFSNCSPVKIVKSTIISPSYSSNACFKVSIYSPMISTSYHCTKHPIANLVFIY